MCPTSRSTAWPLSALGMLLIAVPTLACADADGRWGAETLVRESITVVENPAVSRGSPRFSVPTAPLLEVGMSDGPAAYLFHGVRGAARLEDGSVVVVDGGSQELRAFASDGRHLWTAGGRGAGPGEFREAVAVHRLPGDTLVVHDVTARRLTYFSPRGERLRDVPVNVDPSRGGIAGFFHDGSFLLVELEEGRPAVEGDVARGVARYSRHRPDSYGPRLPLFEQPWAEFIGVNMGTRVVSTVRPYGRTGAARVLGGDIYSGQTDVYGFEVRDSTGSVRVSARLPHQPRPISGGDIEELLRTRHELGVPPANLRRYERVRYPAEYPAWDRMQVRSTGEVWLRSVATPGDAVWPAEWLVFNRTGHFIAIVQTPARLAVREVGHDYLLGVAKDELGIETVQVFELESLTFQLGAADARAN